MSFFYTLIGDYVTIYVDLVFIINLFIDFILLLGVSIILKRNIKLYKALLGALFGSISLIFLFIDISSFSLFLFKIVISVIMILITFKFKSIKYFFDNFFCLYVISIFLGGALYFINNSLSYKSNGFIFYNNGFSINLVLVIILTPIIIYIYIKQSKKLRNNYLNRYIVKIVLHNNKSYTLTGFIDSGNNLYDPYFKHPIILINKNIINNLDENFILVPCLTVSGTSLIKCFNIKELYINNKKVKKKFLLGISDNNFKIDGVDLLLHKDIIRER